MKWLKIPKVGQFFVIELGPPNIEPNPRNSASKGGADFLQPPSRLDYANCTIYLYTRQIIIFDDMSTKIEFDST